MKFRFSKLWKTRKLLWKVKSSRLFNKKTTTSFWIFCIPLPNIDWWWCIISGWVVWYCRLCLWRHIKSKKTVCQCLWRLVGVGCIYQFIYTILYYSIWNRLKYAKKTSFFFLLLDFAFQPKWTPSCTINSLTRYGFWIIVSNVLGLWSFNYSLS